MNSPNEFDLRSELDRVKTTELEDRRYFEAFVKSTPNSDHPVFAAYESDDALRQCWELWKTRMVTRRTLAGRLSTAVQALDEIEQLTQEIARALPAVSPDHRQWLPPETKAESKIRISIEISPEVFALLEVLTKDELGPETVQQVVAQLVDHAQQGVYRPGAWERAWLCQCFSDSFTDHLVPGDPYGRPNCEAIFQQPKQKESGE